MDDVLGCIGVVVGFLLAWLFMMLLGALWLSAAGSWFFHLNFSDCWTMCWDKAWLLALAEFIPTVGLFRTVL